MQSENVKAVRADRRIKPLLWIGLAVAAAGASAFGADAAAEAGAAVGAEAPLIVTADLALEKDAVLRRAIVIRASHITIDGNGAVVEGPGAAGKPETFTGCGVRAEGCSNVTIRNLRVRGFARGIHATSGTGWLIEGCDASGNYHDPEFGWGEKEDLGGIILERICDSVIRGSRAERVWNGLSLTECRRNLISGNRFAYCSNVCLKMWTSCDNVVADNDLSYGLRIRTGEVHARDSTCVLIESGSNDNRFFRNQVTHGGDGLFIRVLNGWVSTGNLFVENDFSHANNNCVESWSPGNTYIRNRANHGSYGFWLGGSDQTVLIGNEAAYNGLESGFHNAPEPGFGHGGIVIVGGSSSHTKIEGNHCHHNRGGGIVFRGDAGTQGRAWRTHHWIVQQNRLENNRWPIWGRWGDAIVLAANRCDGNEEGAHLEDVSGLVELGPESPAARAPVAVLRGPNRAVVGQRVVFDASSSRDPGGRELTFRWSIGDETATGPRVERIFDAPGFRRVGLTVSSGSLADLAFVDLVVAGGVAEEIGTEGDAAGWGFEMQGNEDGRGRVLFADETDALVGSSALRFRPDPYKGMYATAVYPSARDASWDLSGKKSVSFWIKAQNPNIPGFQEPGPVIRLHGEKGAVRLQPSGGRNLLVGHPYSEARWTWMLVEAPLAGSEAWERTAGGDVDLKSIKALSISLDSWGGDPFDIWIDGLHFE